MNNTEKNNQLQEFLTEYTKGNVLIADNGVIEEIEQSNQHFTLTITHEVLSSDIVQFVTFKQHENYTQGDEYNELSDVFDYDNVFSVTMVDGEIIEVKEKTSEKAENNMTKLTNEKWVTILENVSLLDENEEFGNEIEILQLDSTNEFVLAHGYEVFEDGFTSEDEARQRLEEVEQMVHDRKLMKKLKESGVWYPQDSVEFEDLINDLENNPDFSFFTVASSLEKIVEEFEYQGISLNNLVTLATNRYGDVIEIIYNKEYNNYHTYVGAH